MGGGGGGGLFGSVGSMLGLNGGAGGTGFNTQAGANAGQLQTAYQGNQNAMASQQALLAALQGQNGIQNQSNVYNQLQGVVSGAGPNPAQAMLNQATGQNVANQAALAAGQRGAGANVGLMARQAAQTGANLQQQAAGQGATMQAQQSLGALGQAGNMAGNMAANQIGQTNANVGAQQAEQNILQGANSANNNIQGQLANTRMGQQPNVLSNLPLVGGLFGAEGGEVPKKMADGGSAFSSGPQSMFGQFLSGSSEPSTPGFSSAAPAKKGGGGGGLGGLLNAVQGVGGDAASALGLVGAAEGGDVGGALKQGGHVPGKAKVQGNSYKNDNVKALLSPGEVVIPRSVMQSADPIRGSAEFVRAVMAKKGKKL